MNNKITMSSPIVFAQTASPREEFKERKSPYYLHSHKDKYKSSFEISKIVEQSTLNTVPTFFVNL